MKLTRLVVSLLPLLLPFAVQGQIARGTVVDQMTAAPIRGAFVILLNREGRQVAGVLTGEQGEFVFRVPPGRYSLRADRIGHRTANTQPFDLAAEQTQVFRLQLEVAALRLAEITVRGEERCVGRPDASRQTAEVWAEARKALEVAAWVEASGATFRTRSHKRDLNLELNDIEPPQMRFGSASGRGAFFAASPDSLARFGYVQDRGGETFLYGPDAELLLSNSFLTQHCFRLERRNDRPGLIGLGFQPIRSRRLPDIQGVLWLDEKTAELRYIEYGYTNREGYADRRYAGGRTEFEQLPNGAWIVRRWYIRGPRLARVAQTTEIRVLGTHEEGGEVLDAQVFGQSSTTLVPRVSIEGIAFDSIWGRPLEGARVYLSGTPFMTFAGVAGKFRLDSIPAGTYYVAFSHPRADSLPSYPPPRRIETDSALTRIDVALPPSDRIIDLHCPAAFPRFGGTGVDTVRARRGVLFGGVSRGGSWADGVMVKAAFQQIYSPSGAAYVPLESIKVRPLSLETTTDAEGNYIMCGVPVDQQIRLSVWSMDRLLGTDSVRVSWTRIQRHDLHLPRR